MSNAARFWPPVPQPTGGAHWCKDPRASALFPRAYSRPCRESTALGEPGTSRAARATQAAEQGYGVWHDDDPCNCFIKDCINRSQVRSFRLHEPLAYFRPKSSNDFHPSFYQEVLGLRPRGQARALVKGRLEVDLASSTSPSTVSSTRKTCHTTVELHVGLCGLSWSPPARGGRQHNNQHQHGWSLVTMAYFVAEQPDRQVSI